MKACLPLLALSFSTMLAQSQPLQPPTHPGLFMEGSVSTNLNERDMAISPDGKEMYYTLEAAQNAFSTILYRHKLPGNKWSAPEVAPFSGQFKDLEPAFSADGHRLFFSSNRPLSDTQPKDFDIWVVERTKDGTWSSPRNVGAPVNTGANEFYPSVALSGNLYFTSEYEKGVGKEDIYMCPWQGGKYGESIALDTAVNSKLWEFNAFVSPDEKFILFTSYGRKDDQGGGDLYISFRDAGGAWQPAKNVSALNSPKLDYCPFVSFDQKILFFTSSRHDLPATYEKPATHAALVKAYNGVRNGSENIYWIDFQTLVRALK
ncbi:WD40-like Beta Propeller Repeat [Chryseolinea serpens]|uniref:WD40-like Beta Propeller Repeat n=1 Tax=Chryseolinea serpens TaxID=947013 RepID=A0A1M5XI92_9BACT|nr:PD40 domain-containing protein [Chryseolinea serpens]SHH99244.1 WD40-like Beta Propeller Repeat [Chryseolinea serpens]